MVFALSRPWAGIFPLRRQVTVFQIMILLVVMWFLSVIEVLPYAVFLNVSKKLVCDESLPVNSISRSGMLTSSHLLEQKVKPRWPPIEGNFVRPF